MKTVNKGPSENLVNRLSKMQRAVLAFVEMSPRPIGGNISKLPRTGNIIDGIGRPRSPATFAAVSRALKRLEERGLVSSYSSILAARGKGLAYAITVGEPCTGRGVAELKLNRPKPRPIYSRTIDV